MHAHDICHRDLKPENILLCGKNKDMVKVTDFGVSKDFSSGALATFVGTADYMAPEVLRGNAYTKAVDLWAIGVITYVMLAGFHPFNGDNDIQVFASIIATKYSFDGTEWGRISKDAKDFIKAIFIQADKRLTATQCLNHAWITKNIRQELRPEKKAVIPKLIISDEDNLLEDEIKLDPRNSKNQLLEMVNDLMRVVIDNNQISILSGELRTISAVIAVTSGNSSADIEHILYDLYWERLKDINLYLMKTLSREKERIKN